MGAALLTPTVALAVDPTSASDPYGPTTETTTETTPDTTTETTPETTPETTTETAPDTTTETAPDTTTETTPDTTTETTPDTTTETTPDTTTPETAPDTTTETTPDTTTPETAPDTTTPDTTTPETTTTTPAELAVFDPGPCVGAYVTASGSGFNPDEAIDLSRDGVIITTVAAGADGSFSVRVDIAGVQNGEHVITATGTMTGFSSSGTFDVEPQVCTTESGTTVVAVVLATGPAAVSSESALATTGFPVAPVLAAALLALLVGTMLLVVTRNRRRLPSGSEGPQHL
jgi:hypothetical protein